jgi:hypothetical protein
MAAGTSDTLWTPKELLAEHSHMIRRFMISAAVVCLAYGGPVAAATNDPPSARIDPPPPEMDYVGAFPLHKWTFGKLLWQGQEPCTADFCEAAYNAAPVFVLVQHERNCCGEPGYSIMVTVRAKDCATVSYYLAFSKDIQPMPTDERSTLVGRKVGQLVSRILSACGLVDIEPIPTGEVNGLANPTVPPRNH